MAYEQEKKFLAEEAAIRVSYWSNPQTGNAVLVRRWTTSRAELHASSVAYLNTIKTVTNPCAIADGKSKPYPGVWRVFPFQAMLGKGVPEDQQGITQTLVLSVDGDFKWASEDSTLECMYSYAYQNGVGPIQAAVATQGIVTEAKNTLNDQLQYDSEARITHSHPYQWATHTAENALGTTDDIGYKNSRYCPTAPASTVQGTVYDAKSTLNKDGSYDGAVDYETSKAKTLAGMVSESALDVGYEVAYLNSRARPAMPAATVQGLVYDARSTVNKDDTYNGVVGYEASKQAAWSDITETTTGTSSGNSYLNYRTKPSAPTVAAIGFIYDAKLTLNKDGTYSGGVGYEYSKPAQWVDVVDATLGTTVGHSYLNQRTQLVAPSTLAQGFLYDGKSTLNKDGTYNGGVGYDYSKPDMWTDATETILGQSVAYSYLNYRTRPTAPVAAVQGFIYDAKTTDNKDGTYSGGVWYEYSKPDAWVDATETLLGVSVSHSYLNYRTRPTAPAVSVQGFIYDAKTTDNKDGTYSGGIGYEYSKPDAWVDATETVLGKSVAHSYLNYRTRPTAPANAVQGFIYDAKTTDNKDGTYSGGVGYEYSKPDHWVDVSENALTQDVSLSYLNYRTRPSAPSAAVQGFVYDAKTTDNKDGTYNGGVGYEYSKPDQWTDVVENTLATDTAISYLNYRTRPTAPASAVVGVLYDAKSTDNKDGTYNGNVGQSYSKPIVMESHQTTASMLEATYEVAYLNSRDIPVVPAATIGWVYDAKSTLNKDGSYNGGVESGYAAPVELYLTWASNDGTKGLRKYQNQQSVPATIAALTTETDNSVFASYNDKNGTLDLTAHIVMPQGGLSMVQATFNLSDNTSAVRQVMGYSESKGKWLIQNWTRHEQYCKNRSAAVTAIGGATKENPSITYTPLSGGYWLAVWWVRDGAQQEKTNSNDA